MGIDIFEYRRYDFNILKFVVFKANFVTVCQRMCSCIAQLLRGTSGGNNVEQ